ncbi:hypothetical protein [Bdellovibrio sp. BCCA]|uniref:hypothetical protein n=1 Tax=Bdellovibrio sp. BCCA TaxID=3136281 RepID=UPI0030F0AD07
MVKTKSIGFFIALFITPLVSQGKAVRMSSSETAKLCDSLRPNPTTKLKSDLKNISAAASKALGGDDLTHVEVECILKPTDGQNRCDDKVATQISQNDL